MPNTFPSLAAECPAFVVHPALLCCPPCPTCGAAGYPPLLWPTLPPPAKQAFRILSHSYGVVLPITSLAFPPLPLSNARPASPASYGPLPAAQTPWLQLALYTALGAGPRTLVLAAGQRLSRLPPQLRGASHALLWPWDAASVKAQVGHGHLALGSTTCARSPGLRARSPWVEGKHHLYSTIGHLSANSHSAGRRLPPDASPSAAHALLILPRCAHRRSCRWLWRRAPCCTPSTSTWLGEHWVPCVHRKLQCAAAGQGSGVRMHGGGRPAGCPPPALGAVSRLHQQGGDVVLPWA